MADLDKTKLVINFSEKNSKQFRKFRANLSNSNSNSTYIRTNRVKLHGLYKVTSIDVVDFSCPFDVNPNGIIVFLTEDINDSLLFDFSYDSQGLEMIEVKLQGKHWLFVPIEFVRPVS